MMSRSFTKREKILLLIMAVLLLGLVYYRFVIVETANAVERYDVTELESELLVAVSYTHLTLPTSLSV